LNPAGFGGFNGRFDNEGARIAYAELRQSNAYRFQTIVAREPAVVVFQPEWLHYISTRAGISPPTPALTFPGPARPSVDASYANCRRTHKPFPPATISFVERFAVQRRGRRTSGSLMLLQFPCGDCVRCNGLFDGEPSSL